MATPSDSRPRLEARVLVVEDDPDIRRMVCASLETAGATSDEAADADEALAKMADGTFDAAVLDWNLGATSSASLLEKMRNDHPKLFSRTLVTTGDVVSTGDDNAEARLGRPLLAKPFAPVTWSNVWPNYLPETPGATVTWSRSSTKSRLPTPSTRASSSTVSKRLWARSATMPAALTEPYPGELL